ncbi:MAG TPA: hypothetical protein DHW42_04780 [Candidatus Marinimicrobia bacterium]|nr:hypothetical protein [Candidatus Neomarinimicrobiota bacterium]
MKKYIIWSPPFQPDSGGVTILHKLCHMLNEHGQNAFIWPWDNNFEIFNTNGKYNTPLAKREMLPDAIVIYPEIAVGNPLHANHVVRWILNVPGVIGGDGVFGKNDMIYYYSKAFTEGREEDKFLQIIEIYGDLFRNYNMERSGSCFVRRKGKNRKIVHDLNDSVEIVNTTPSPALVNLFNKRKYFYSYDTATFLSLQAAMCGCISIIVPMDGICLNEWIEMSPTRKYGIAYGEENIDHAIRTMHKVKPNLESVENRSIKQLEDFIIKTQENAKYREKESLFIPHRKQEEKEIRNIVSIIIPVFNKVEYTKKCIDAIYANTQYRNFEIIIVDNASTDGTDQYLRELEKERANIRIIHNEENFGFAKANNQAAEIAKGEYLLLLNNNTEVQKGWLEPLLNVLNADPDVATVGSKMLFPDGTIQHAGVIVFDDQKLPDPLVARHIYYGQSKFLAEANIPKEYQILTAACLLIRKNIYEKAGGFDEGYWNGYEDVDLCFNIQKMGKKLVYQPQSIVIHHESKSGSERFSKVSRNIERLHSKWLGKIIPDFIIMKDGALQKTKTNKILPYKMPSRRIMEQTDISASTNKFVSIILLTYNALEYTKKCIKSIREQTQYPYEIIFVDNGSTDGTKRYLRNLIQKHTNFKLIANKTNKGFAVGNNQGVRQAKGEYVMILNNDVLVSDGWLESMVNSLERDEKIGMVGPLTNYISGRQRVAKIPYNDENGFLEFAGQVREANKNKLTPRRRIAGFAVLMRKSLYEEVSGLDESYGTGNYEDDDLCLKVQEKGHAIMVDESTFIHHYGSRTFKSNKINYKKSLTEKGARFKEKWQEVDYEELLELKNPLESVHSKLLEKGTEYLSCGNIKKGIKNFEEILKTNPINQDALFGLALSARQKNDNETALKHLKKLLQLNPNHAGAYNLSGMISFETGNLENAKKLFATAIEKDPKFVEAQRNFGEVLLALEDYDTGVQTFMVILENHPDDVLTLIRVAQLYIEVGQMTEATPYLEKAKQLEPNNSQVVELIEFMSKEGNIEMNSLQTEDREEKQVEKDSRLENATNQLTEGNIEQANLLFSEVLSENPQSEDALFGLALCARQQKDNESALRHLNRLIKINPNCADAYNLSGMISFETGDFESSKMLFIAAIEKDHKFIEAQRNYGEVLLALEDYENGVKAFTAILEKHPEDVPSLLRMAQLYAEVGKNNEAGRYAAKVLEYDSENSLAKEICNNSPLKDTEYH